MSPYSLINPGIVRLLHSPAHAALSRRLMTVSYCGRKTGKAYCTPVSYYRQGEKVYCFTNGNWRHNFTEQTEARLRLRGDDYTAQGIIDRSTYPEQVATMSAYFKAVPQDRKFYGVRCAAGEPVSSDVERALQAIEIIRFTLH